MAKLPPELRERILQGSIDLENVPPEYRDIVNDYNRGLAERTYENMDDK